MQVFEQQKAAKCAISPFISKSLPLLRILIGLFSNIYFLLKVLAGVGIFLYLCTRFDLSKVPTVKTLLLNE